MFLLLRPWALDLRALAACRVLLGWLVVLDAWTRGADWWAHYTDVGVLPRAVLLSEFSNPFHFSLLLASGQPLWVALCLLSYGLAGLSLLLGWRTWGSTLVVWLLLLSLHNRNPMVLNGGDVYLRLLLFWGLFLPWGARFSLDVARSREATLQVGNLAPSLSLSGGSLGWTLQVCLLYGISAVLKRSPEWWPEGSATWYALSLEQFTTPLGDWLRQFPTLLQGLTWFVYGLEALSPLLLLCPLGFVLLRTMTVLLLMGMHLGFAITMEIGLFPWVCLAALLALLPSPVWDWLAARSWGREMPGLKLTLYYDKDCGFCLRMVRLIREFLLLGRAEVRAIQDETRVHRCFNFQTPTSWVVERGELQQLGGAGLWLVLQQTPGVSWLVRWLPEQSSVGVLESGYRWVARHRSPLGRATSWLGWRPQPPTAVPHWYLSLTALLFALLILGYNLRYSFFKEEPLPRPVQILFQALRLDQSWSMFAPRPSKDDGWYVMEGELADGSPVDVYRRQAGTVSFAKPEDPSALYQNQRWRKYLMNLWLKQNKDHRLHYGRYLCRSWNRSETEPARKLASFRIHFMLERPGIPGEGPRPPERRTIWRHQCL